MQNKIDEKNSKRNTNDKDNEAIEILNEGMYVCPDCKQKTLVPSEKCFTCIVCGWSPCE